MWFACLDISLAAPTWLGDILPCFVIFFFLLFLFFLPFLFFFLFVCFMIWLFSATWSHLFNCLWLWMFLQHTSLLFGALLVSSLVIKLPRNIPSWQPSKYHQNMTVCICAVQFLDCGPCPLQVFWSPFH